MENQDSIFQATAIDTMSTEHLGSTSKWTRFIGVMYTIFGILTLSTAILIIANVDEIAKILMQYNGISDSAMEFIQGAGKWLFLLIFLLISIVFFVNAFYLIKFGNSFHDFRLRQEESNLTKSFDYMGKYLMITTILSVVSTLSAIGMIIFSILK